ncbi:hypothetical protein HYS48_01825 [Candidatus Woesearchaeota archaeon]|nr:hypothetical protein [Candidatus Woesearchaeota archaeon]
MKQKRRDPEDVLEEELLGEVHFEIAEDAFRGPYTCHKRKTKRIRKMMQYKGLQYPYEVWQCPICKKEFLDFYQSPKLELFWMLQKLLDENVITLERNINYDGKTFFIRFPKDITKKWKKHGKAAIKILTPTKLLIEVKE